MYISQNVLVDNSSSSNQEVKVTTTKEKDDSHVFRYHMLKDNFIYHVRIYMQHYKVVYSYQQYYNNRVIQ